MTVRDQGFRPYSGARLAPSNNIWVLWRHGLSRAGKSWLVRGALIMATLPLLVALVAWVFMGFVASQNPAVKPPDLVGYVRDLLRGELWLSGTAIAFGAGASAIADDVARHALPFFFAKPVSAWQYLLGRAGAVFTLILSVLLVPALLFVPLAIALDAHHAPRAALVLFPAATAAVVSAAALACVSLGISALSASRGLTGSLFASVWLIPHVVASVASLVSDSSWAYLISLPGQLTFLLASLIDRPGTPHDPTALHALPLILATSALGVYLALLRLDKARGET